MRYDRHGFPIPAEFEPPVPDDQSDLSGPSRLSTAGQPRAGRRQARPGRGKRIFLLAVLLGLVVPAIAGPAVMPTVRQAVVQWSLERAIMREGRGAVGAAIGDVTRAIDWAGRSLENDPQWKSSLLCWRAMLKIENRDTGGGLADADLAASVAPTAIQPLRIRALANVILGDADAALAAAEAASRLAGPVDPEALNHLAYIRALVGRDLEVALADIETALAGDEGGSPERLDTRGYILHLLGRQQEAIDDLNLAIEAAQEERRRLVLLSGHVTRGELDYRLRSADQALAVMHHHRGLACKALGLLGQAEQDLTVAEQKGFDPSRGVF
jgi:tetratricopeptide (TPR) repeat protein